MTDKERLLREFSAIYFALHETALFLDTHPKNAEALRAVKRYGEKARELKEEYEKKYGMVTTASAFEANEKWPWVAAPWPWQ